MADRGERHENRTDNYTLYSSRFLGPAPIFTSGLSPDEGDTARGKTSGLREGRYGGGDRSRTVSNQTKVQTKPSYPCNILYCNIASRFLAKDPSYYSS